MTTLGGIDISHHQKTTPPLSGLTFVGVRATYGTDPDDRYGQHAAVVLAAHLVLIPYHFGRDVVAVGDQVRAFLEVAGDARLVALDVELDAHRDRPADPPMSWSKAARFIAAVQATGRRVLLYHSEFGFRDVGQDGDWVANWSHEPSRHWTFWQYRGSPLDLDRFAGSLAELKALAGLVRAPGSTSTAPVAVSSGRNNVAIRYSPITATRTRMALRKGQGLFERPGGKRVTAMSGAGRVPHVGLAGSVNGQAWRAVVVGTRWSYRDRKPHPTVLFVPAAAGKVAAS